MLSNVHTHSGMRQLHLHDNRVFPKMSLQQAYHYRREDRRYHPEKNMDLVSIKRGSYKSGHFIENDLEYNILFILFTVTLFYPNRFRTLVAMATYN